MTRLLVILICAAVFGCGALTSPPELPEHSETAIDSIAPKDSTGSITIIIICPDCES